MATQAQKTAELTAAERRVTQTTARLEQAKRNVSILAKKLQIQTDALNWLQSMPVSDSENEPETDRS